MGQNRSLAAADVRARFRDVVEEVRRERVRVRITRYGRTRAVLIPAEDLDLLERCEDARAGRADGHGDGHADGHSDGHADRRRIIPSPRPGRVSKPRSGGRPARR